MAEKGFFRSALSGFHKQDVLEYIDQITAAWDNERKELAQQAEAGLAEMDAMRQALQQAQADAEHARAEAEAARAETEGIKTQLSDVAAELDTRSIALQSMEERLRDKEAQLAELAALQQQVQSLQQQLDEAITDRDTAIAAVADAREQLAQKDEKLNTADQQLAQQADQLTNLKREISRYQAALSSTESAQKHVEGIVRPFIDQANRHADETLDNIQAVLAALLAQLGELQGNVEQRRQALHRCKDDSDSRLSAAFGDWLNQARDAATQTAPRDAHFFR